MLLSISFSIIFVIRPSYPKGTKAFLGGALAWGKERDSVPGKEVQEVRTLRKRDNSARELSALLLKKDWGCVCVHVLSVFRTERNLE